jgi:hypothetical protein
MIEDFRQQGIQEYLATKNALMHIDKRIGESGRCYKDFGLPDHTKMRKK